MVNVSAEYVAENMTSETREPKLYTSNYKFQDIRWYLMEICLSLFLIPTCSS